MNYANSIQNFSVTIASGSTTGTVTLPTSIIDTAILLYGGTATTATTSMAQGSATLSISVVAGVATVTATRLTSSTNTVTVTGCVIDGDSTNLVKSVQYVTVTPTAEGVTNTTITSVNTSYAIAHLLGVKAGNATFNLGANTPLLQITTATNLASTINTRTTSLSYTVAIIEWQPAACNQAVQFFSKSWTNSTLTTTQAITSVNVDNTLLFYAGYDNDANETHAGDNMLAQITSPTVVTISCGVIEGDTPIVYNGYVTEFVSGVMSQAVQRGTITIAASTSGNTATLGTSVPSTLAGCNFTGWTSTNTAITSLANAVANVQLTSTSVVTAHIGGTVPASKNTVIGYEVFAIAAGTAGSAGSATGSSSVGSTGSAQASATGSSTGTSTASASSVSLSSGAATGTATVSGLSQINFSGVGAATGTSTVSGNSGAISVGTATGTATVQAASIITARGVGAATGTATVSGIAGGTLGTAIGTANVSGVGKSNFAAVGNATGMAIVGAMANYPIEFEAVLGFMSNAPVPVLSVIGNNAVSSLGLMSEELDLLCFLTNNNVSSLGVISNSPISVTGSF